MMNFLCPDIGWKIFHPKHHVALWVMPLCTYRKEDISNSFTRSSHKRIPRPSKTVYPGKRPSCIFSTSTTHGQRQFKQLESRVCSGEQGALAGWYSCAEMPLEKRSFIKIVICHRSHPPRGCLLLTGSIPREGALVKYSYIRRNYICKRGLQRDNWLEGRAGKNNRREGGKRKAEYGKWKVSCDFSLPKCSEELRGLCWASFLRACRGNRFSPHSGMSKQHFCSCFCETGE